MNTIDLTEQIFSVNRTELRKKVINLFLKENPGTGKGEFTSRHKYIVKKKGDHEIYLIRPAQFNNGFDFTLNVSNINFNPDGKATTRPTHQNIIDDLAQKKERNTILYDELKAQIDKTYNCQILDRDGFNFGVGIDSEILLECIKWLFVEQDVTYWNYSGRAMLYNAIQEI